MDLARLRINKSIFSSLGILQIPIFGEDTTIIKMTRPTGLRINNELVCYINSV